MDALAAFVGILLGGVLAFAVLAGLDQLVRLVRRHRWASRRTVAAPPPSPPPPSWFLTLLVDVDEEAELFRPSVQLRGSAVPWLTRIRLELVDEHGAIRLTSECPLPSWAIGAELPLPAFSPPDGVAVERVLAWRWDVVIEAEGRERARWREHPAAAGPLNAEAELELSGVGDPEETDLLRRIGAESGFSPLLVELRALRWLADQVEAGHADDLDLDEFAAQVLGSEGEPSALGHLRDVLGGPDDEPTRLAAGRRIYSRCMLDESLLMAARPALSGALARGLRSGDLRARAACLWAVVKLGGDDTHAVIAGVLPETDEDARFEIVRILGFISDHRATPVLVEALAREPSAKIRSAILWALGTLADPAALQPSIDALQDGDPETRGYAAWALGKMHDPAALLALREALSDPNPDVRMWVEEAVRILESSLPTR